MREEQEELGQVGCSCCFEFGMTVRRKSFCFAFTLFATRPRAGDCQVEADRKLFWDWFFPLLGLGTGHLALNAVLSLLLCSCSEREQGERHTCGK